MTGPSQKIKEQKREFQEDKLYVLNNTQFNINTITENESNFLKKWIRPGNLVLFSDFEFYCDEYLSLVLADSPLGLRGSAGLAYRGLVSPWKDNDFQPYVSGNVLAPCGYYGIKALYLIGTITT